MADNFLSWMAFALCLVMSFLFSGMEAGVLALSRLRIRHQMRLGRPSARVLYGFLENRENFLWTILVGNTLVNFAVFAWLFALLHAYLGLARLLFAVVFVLVVILFYTFFDLLPKMLFRSYPNRLCLVLARPFRFVHISLRPLVAIVEWFSRVLLHLTGGKAYSGYVFGGRDELRMTMVESAQVFTTEERAMINRALELENQTVRRIMLTMTEAVTVSAETTVRDVLTLIREKHLTRIPVWQTREGKRSIAGLVNINTLLLAAELDENRAVAEHLNPALFLDEGLRLDEALRRMQRGGERLAVVLGRDGRETGIVSLEDILKTIFGEVRL